ncbi:MAG: type IV pilus assembly protein PilM [Nitrospirae bacterium]|nr:type IV pilus assembly protein PilM [Nitrospirota bacterium]
MKPLKELLNFKKKNPIGLDIGSGYIKAVQLNNAKDGYELSLMSILPLDHDLIVEGNITDKKRLAAAVKEVLKKAGARGGEAVIGVSGHSSVIIKKIAVPAMSAEELGTSIRYEAEQYIPFDINDVNIDFEIIGPKADEEGQMDVLLVAAKKNVISDYAEVIELAGLDALILDVDAFALSNMYELCYAGTDKKNVALVNVGASKTNINVLHEGRPVFTRDSAMGSNYHTETLERELEITWQNAEKLKMGESVAGVSPESVQLAMTSASDEIYTEIYRSFEYFKSSVADETEVSEVILSGGAALIKGFPEMMAEKLGMQVNVADPFNNIKISDKLDPGYVRKMAPIAAVAVGLALRRGGDKL